jgi:hypothetical protein
MTQAKPFSIPKREVWEAFKRVKANRGAAGVDGQSIQDFEARLAANLYKLWNRLSSGSYMPPPVRRVDIPKGHDGTRPLGIPTVADRIAQEVVRRYLEPILEPVFHPDSYGYRPGRSAIDAIRTARQRCWRSDWVLDIDIKGFFDSIDHELLLRAVRKHTECAWVRLYIERWLKAPAMLDSGELVARTQGHHKMGSSARLQSCKVRLPPGSGDPGPEGNGATRKTTLMLLRSISTRLTRVRIRSRWSGQLTSAIRPCTRWAKSSSRPMIRAKVVRRAASSRKDVARSSQPAIRCRRPVMRGSNSALSIRLSA